MKIGNIKQENSLSNIVMIHDEYVAVMSFKNLAMLDGRSHVLQ